MLPKAQVHYNKSLDRWIVTFESREYGQHKRAYWRYAVRQALTVTALFRRAA